MDDIILARREEIWAKAAVMNDREMVAMLYFISGYCYFDSCFWEGMEKFVTNPDKTSTYSTPKMHSQDKQI